MDLYSEIILDHYKNPQNYGKLKNPDASATGDNPLCGDKIRIDFIFKNEKVKKVAFSGEGCAISQAATSMLTEKLIGKTKKQIEKISNEDIYKMLGIKISPGRVKCALLGLTTIKKCLEKQ